ncbi:MAG: hypothetical protein AAF687_01695 [Pseudomonadota bacterium]
MPHLKLRCALLASALISTPALAQTNQIYNPGFEMGPPISLGNNFIASNTSHAVGWFDSGGSMPNVVKVDGPGDTAPCQDYGSNGPENDASGLATCNNPRHYLDITSGSNTVYQRFTPKCKGEVTFGASFSSRANSRGFGAINIRSGNVITAPILSSTNVTVPGGISKTDPWRQTTGSIVLQAGQTYIFEVDMDNQLNMDDAFVYFSDCDEVPDLPDVENPDWEESGNNGTGGGGGDPILDDAYANDDIQYEIAYPVPDDPIEGPSPCCAPWSEQDIPTALMPVFPTDAASPYTMQYMNPASLNAQMGAYLNYVHAMDPTITQISMQWQALDLGTGVTPNNAGPIAGSAQTVTWTWTPNGVQSSITGGGFWTGTPFQVNRWYGYVTKLMHNGPQNSIYFDEDCLNNSWKFRWSSQGMRGRTRNVGQFETVDAQGKVVRSTRMSVRPGQPLSLNPPQTRARPMQRR